MNDDHYEPETYVMDIVDVSSLKGDAALESCNHGLVECTCDRFHTCQACDYYDRMQAHAEDQSMEYPE